MKLKKEVRVMKKESRKISKSYNKISEMHYNEEYINLKKCSDKHEKTSTKNIYKEREIVFMKVKIMPFTMRL